MINGSNNSWSFNKPNKWWMKPLYKFYQTQNINIIEQYTKYNTRAFELKIHFHNKKLNITNGIITFNYSKEQLYQDLMWLATQQDTIYVKITHNIRNYTQINFEELMMFRNFCKEINTHFPNIIFYGGNNLLPKANNEYNFKNDNLPTTIYVKQDNIFTTPYKYAKKHNKNIIQQYNKQNIILLNNFVNIKT